MSITITPYNLQTGFATYVEPSVLPGNLNSGIAKPPDNLNPGIIGPLSSLYTQQKGNLNILQYPSDLGSAQKRHYVKFYVKEIVQGDGSRQQARGLNISGQIAGGGSGQAYGIDVSPRITDPKAVICLYMPDTLNSTYNASYDELSLTAEAGKYINTAEKILDFSKGIGTRNAGSQASMDSAAAGASLGASLKGVIAEKAGAGTSVADINLQAKGYAINPQLQMLYRGVAFRQFQLTFFFTPSSKSEAESVDKILFTIKRSFAPDIINEEVGGNIGMFFQAPDIFNVDFMIDNGLNPHLPKYGDCVLTDMDVNYAPSGFATHQDGSPVQIQLNLTFKEIEIVTRKKLDTGIKGATNGTDGGLR